MVDRRSSTLTRALEDAAHRPRRPPDLAAIARRAAERRRLRRIVATLAVPLIIAGAGVTAAVIHTADDDPVIVESAARSATAEGRRTDAPLDTMGTASPSSATEKAPIGEQDPPPEQRSVPGAAPDAPSETQVPPPQEERQVNRFEITARIEVLDATAPPPFTVDATDPGVVVATEGSRHEVGLTGTEGTVYLTDPMFHDDLRYGNGRLRTAGRGCDPAPEAGCTTDGRFLRVEEGQRNVRTIALYTAELGPGTYILEQPIEWARDLDDYTGPDGRAILRITYEVQQLG
jgi:hypothetical protein